MDAPILLTAFLPNARGHGPVTFNGVLASLAVLQVHDPPPASQQPGSHNSSSSQNDEASKSADGPVYELQLPSLVLLCSLHVDCKINVSQSSSNSNADPQESSSSPAPDAGAISSGSAAGNSSVKIAESSQNATSSAPALLGPGKARAKKGPRPANLTIGVDKPLRPADMIDTPTPSSGDTDTPGSGSEASTPGSSGRSQGRKRASPVSPGTTPFTARPFYPDKTANGGGGGGGGGDDGLIGTREPRGFSSTGGIGASPIAAAVANDRDDCNLPNSGSLMPPIPLTPAPFVEQGSSGSGSSSGSQPVSIPPMPMTPVVAAAARPASAGARRRADSMSTSRSPKPHLHLAGSALTHEYAGRPLTAGAATGAASAKPVIDLNLRFFGFEENAQRKLTCVSLRGIADNPDVVGNALFVRAPLDFRLSGKCDKIRIVLEGADSANATIVSFYITGYLLATAPDAKQLMNLINLSTTLELTLLLTIALPIPDLEMCDPDAASDAFVLAAIASQKQRKYTQLVDFMLKAKSLYVLTSGVPIGKQLAIFHAHAAVALAQSFMEGILPDHRSRGAAFHVREAATLWETDDDAFDVVEGPLRRAVLKGADALRPPDSPRDTTQRSPNSTVAERSPSPPPLSLALARHVAGFVEILVAMLSSGIEYHQAAALDGLALVFEIALHATGLDLSEVLGHLLQFHDSMAYASSPLSQMHAAHAAGSGNLAAAFPALAAAPAALDASQEGVGNGPGGNDGARGPAMPAAATSPARLAARHLLNRSRDLLQRLFESISTRLDERAVRSLVRNCIVPFLEMSTHPEVRLLLYRLCYVLIAQNPSVGADSRLLELVFRDMTMT